MSNLTTLVDKDGLIHVYYWGNTRPTTYPAGGYSAHQYKDKHWSVCVDGTDGYDVTPNSKYYGVGSGEGVSIDETKTKTLKIAVANGIVGTTHRFKLVQRGKPDRISEPIHDGAWAEFHVELGNDAADYDISVVGGDDPKFRIRYKSGG